MTTADLDAVEHSAISVDIMERLLVTTFGRDVAVNLGLVENYDSDLLPLQLMEFSKDAGRIAHQTWGT